MPKTVADIMTADVVSLSMEDEFDVAKELMKHDHIRHLPVLHQGKVVGLLSHRDVLREQAKLLRLRPAVEEGSFFASVKVTDAMTPDVDVVPSTMLARDAAQILLDKRYGCLPVVDDGKLVGIVTETDILRWAVGLDSA